MCTGKLWSMSISWWIPIPLKHFVWSFDVGVLAVVFEPMVKKTTGSIWCFAKRIPQKCRNNLTPTVEGFAMAISRILNFFLKISRSIARKQASGRFWRLNVWSWFLQEMASIKKLLGCPMFSKKRSYSTFSISFGLKRRWTQDPWWFPTKKSFFQRSSLWCVLQVLPKYKIPWNPYSKIWYRVCAFLTGCYMSERVKMVGM